MRFLLEAAGTQCLWRFLTILSFSILELSLWEEISYLAYHGLDNIQQRSRGEQQSCKPVGEQVLPRTEANFQPAIQPQPTVKVKGACGGPAMAEGKRTNVSVTHSQLKQSSNPSATKTHHGLARVHHSVIHPELSSVSQLGLAGSAMGHLVLLYLILIQTWKYDLHVRGVSRFGLPDSLGYVLASVYLAYPILTPLFETVSSFKDASIERGRDQGRCHDAIKEVGLADLNVRDGVTRIWYMKVVNNSYPAIGWLYRAYPIPSLGPQSDSPS